MKSVNRRLTIVLLMLLMSLGSLMMITGCKKESGIEKPVERSTDVEQEDIGYDDW